MFAVRLFIALRTYEALQRKKLPKSEITMEVGGWSRSHSDFFFFLGKSSQNSPKPVIMFWSSIGPTMCILYVYALLKVVGYYDLSVLSMSVMGFPKKKFGWGVGGWVG